jgi:hypothetical protein
MVLTWPYEPICVFMRLVVPMWTLPKGPINPAAKDEWRTQTNRKSIARLGE